MTELLAISLSWDPAIRGILVVAVGVVVLVGSVYLLLATNMGSRVGFLLAVGGLAGWMAIMGLLWWVYAIGYVGPLPSWEVTEVVTSDDPDDLAAASLEEARDLSDWERLSPDDPARGEAQAAADEAITAEESRVQVFESATEYVPLAAYETGGKPARDGDSTVDRVIHKVRNVLPLPHPPHYAVVQVQDAIDVDVPFGEAPPPAEPDPDAPVVSVVMVRDLGSERLPPALLTISSFIVLGVVSNVLHRRDKEVVAARSRAGADA